jgi:hypothetical protein
VNLIQLLFPVVVCGMIASKMKDKETIEWQDRSYRLLHNEGQNRLDTFTTAGLTAAVLVGPTALALPVVSAAGMGVLGGLATTMAFKLIPK